MYFKKLEIIGFKSFAEQTLLKFEPGITAVVGPNGCGKSNIFDSIRWVLGEQSIKSLRGSKMEDVIFNGTEKIPALGFAEVSLTISNEANILPIDYQEVTVTRRLYRSGESEYFLNNNPVRLKDINELLMGTGIGAESYSLIEQGKIDLVLSSRPEDRRLVFDEATGVSKYKAKKKEALRKLEETQNNLLRVNDIIVEVKRQIGSIERQANKARRYKEVFDKLKELEIRTSQNEINCLTAHSNELKNTETSLKEKASSLAESLSEISRQISVTQNEIEILNQEIRNINNELLNSQNLIERETQHIKINEERIVELTKRSEVIEIQKNNLITRIEQNKENLSKINIEFNKIKQENQRKQTVLDENELKLKEVDNIIFTAKEKTKQANAKIFEIASNKTKLNNEAINVSNSLNNFNARKRRIDIELQKTKQEKDSNESELSNLRKEAEELRNKFQDMKENVDSLKNNLSGLNNEIKNIYEEIGKLNKTMISLQSQKEFLQELKLKYDDMPSAKEAELTIKDIETSSQNEISGIIAKAKSVSFDQENKICRIICEAKLFSLDIQFIEQKISEIDLQIQEKNNSLILQKEKLQELQAKIENQETQMQKEQIALLDKEAVLKNYQSNFDKISEELSLLEFEQNDMNENIEGLTKRDQELKKELEEINRISLEQENTIKTSQTEISANSGVRESLLLSITKLKTEISNVKTKEDDLSTTVSILEKSLSSDTETLNTQEEEKVKCITKIQELKQEILNLGEQINTLKEKTTQAQKLLEIKNQEFTQKENLLGGLINQENKQNSQVLEIKDSLHSQQLNIQEDLFKINQIKERCLQLYQCNIEQIAEFVQLSEIDFAATKQEIEILRQKVDSFGTVNLVAIEELDELKKRHEFLEHQQNDLNSARESLNEAISKINRTTRRMFLDTFHEVAKEFKNYFRLLFGGGDAELFLLDEENVLESGIEIVCKPPGKKLQNILLLSGGERAMSAIALIFAIFKVKPAPFCVLDEIDAALDESNVDRFSRMLEDFAKISQFIVITHNKKTIAHANVMYGITMMESGISKIVSVKLSENNNEPNNQPDPALSAVDLK